MLYADPQSSPQRTGIRRIWSSKTKLYFFEHNRRLLCEPWRQCFTTDKLWNRVLSNCSFESSFSTNQTYNCYFRAHTMIRHINYWMCAVQSRGCPLLFEWWFISSSCHVRKAVKIINASGLRELFFNQLSALAHSTSFLWTLSVMIADVQSYSVVL